MSKWRCVLIPFLLIIAMTANAEVESRKNNGLGKSCSVNGTKDFIVTFTVVGSNTLQELFFTQGNKREETVWYTQQYNSNATYIFNEQSLVVGQSYEVKIEYQDSVSTEHYYLKGATDADYFYIESKNVPIKNGNLDAEGLEIESIECFDDVVVLPPAPEIPEIPETCDVFPNVAQSWSGAPTSKILFGNTALIGTENFSGRIGFEDVVKGWNEQKACDGESCEPDPALAISSPEILELNIPDGRSLVDPNEPIEPGEYTSISLGNGKSFDFTGGTYQIGDLTVLGGASIDIPEGTILLVNQLEFSNAAKVNVTGSNNIGITIWAEDYEGSPAYVNLASNSIDELKAYVFSRQKLDITGTAKVIGAIAADNVQLLGSARVEYTNDNCGQIPGGRQLVLTPRSAINLTCDAPETLDFQVLDSNNQPDGSFTGNINATFTGSNTYTTNVTQGALDTGTLYTTNGQGLLQIELSDRTVGTVSVVAFIEGSESNTTQDGSYQFVPNKFAISDQVQAIVANKRKEITITAQQCDENGEPVNIPADVYSGDKTLTISDTEYIAPKNDVAVEATIAVADKQNVLQQSQVTLNFSQNGDVTTEVLYPEAGSVTYTLTDQVCITDENDVEQCEQIVGLQQLDARPWTFAICHDQKSLTGTASSGSDASDALVAAGDTFELLLQPLRYIDGAADPAKIEVKDYCGRPQTQNFFGTDAPYGTVTVQSPEVDSPEGGELGAGLQGTTTLSNLGRSELQMDDLYWQDVGSLQVEASGYYLNSIQPGVRPIGRFYPAFLTADDQMSKPAEHSQFAYLEQPLQHQFSVYAHARDGQKVKNYHLFGLGFVSQIRYVAQTDSNQDLTERLYDGNTAIALDYTQLHWGQDTDDQTSLLGINFDDFIFKRSPVNGQSTTPDGPFTASNSDFGLQVTEVVDGATWQNSDQLNGLDDQFVLLQSHYDFRYGRMVLADVGANSGQTTVVPLSVEVWGADGFATNQDDGSIMILGSTYNGAYYCAQKIWLDSAVSAASLTGDGGVIDGRASEQSNPDSSWLYAVHSDDSIREQQRLWLRLGPQPPLKLNSSDADILCPGANYTDRPWLRYNWRNLGDEDPSAVVTFGVYRGNDRVIYRGESGLIGN
jgi:MSHA biogenesis protein MshQ